jgi:hypothetical protein
MQTERYSVVLVWSKRISGSARVQVGEDDSAPPPSIYSINGALRYHGTSPRPFGPYPSRHPFLFTKESIATIP